MKPLNICGKKLLKTANFQETPSCPLSSFNQMMPHHVVDRGPSPYTVLQKGMAKHRPSREVKGRAFSTAP